MATRLKRMTFAITSDMEAPLDSVKKELVLPILWWIAPKLILFYRFQNAVKRCAVVLYQ